MILPAGHHGFGIPLPWKGTYYAINWDEPRRGRRLLVVAWHFKFGAFFLRIGWSHRFDAE